MELRSGYKQTEVGVIPDDWEVKPLRDIGSFKKGRNIPKSQLSTDGHLCVLYGEIYTKYNCVAKELTSHIPDEIAQQSTPIQYGDILFAGSGETAEEIGKCFAYTGTEKAYAGGDLIIMSPEEDDSTFLGYQLNSGPICKQKAVLGQGSSVVHIYASGLATVEIPIPSTVDEQKAIASTLNDVNALIASLDKLIAKKRLIKQGAMQQLLTGKTRLPGFNGKWNVKKVYQLGEIVTGGTPPTKTKEFWGGNIPWVTPTDITTKKDISETERQITPLGLSAIRELPAKSVLVTCIASIGKNVILRKVGASNQQINAVIPNVENNLDFLYYLFEINIEYLKSNAGITATSIISKRDFSELTFLVPILKEQQAIATVLSDLDVEISALEHRRDKTHLLKQGMMQELLTGKTRLI